MAPKWAYLNKEQTMLFRIENQISANSLLRGLSNLFLASVFLFVTACGSDKEDTAETTKPKVVVEAVSEKDVAAEMRANKEKWLSYGITDYKIEMQKICFCSKDAVRLMIFDVVGNKINEVRYADTGEIVDAKNYSEDNTVVGLFNLVEGSISKNPEEISIIYDERYGYIKQLSIDFQQNIADDEFSIIASNMKPHT